MDPDRKVRNGASACNAIAHVAPHQQPALRVHVIAERQLCEVAAVERDQMPAQEAAEHNAAVALVGRQVVGLALRDS